MTIKQLLILWLSAVVSGTPPCTEYGCHQLYLPAPPGKTPACAKRGRTYCEHLDHYPEHVIQFLVERWEYDFNTLFTSEKATRDYIRPRPVYGPPAYHGYAYSSVNSPAFYQTPPPISHQSFNTINFNQSQEGYPDRQYNLGDPSLHLLSTNPEFVYSAVIRPELASYNPQDWWKRYARNVRKKRQSGIPTTLCPTRSQFIMPKAALNTQGNWMYIVNLDQDQKYTQLIRSETCISPQCNGICSLPNGYSSKCEQQFVQKRLVALEGSGRTLYTDLFWLPHCCICQITQNTR